MESANKPVEEVTSSASSSESWKERILYPTVLAGIIGGGVGLVSKHRKVHGLANISSTYAANFAIVTGFYCGAREFVRVNRRTGPDDLISSAVAGFGSGAILGRLQGGRIGAVRYSIAFAIVGTAADFAVINIKKSFQDTMPSGASSILEKIGSWLRMPEWSPIRILDEEALAAKRAQEQQLQARIRELRKEGS